MITKINPFSYLQTFILISLLIHIYGQEDVILNGNFKTNNCSAGTFTSYLCQKASNAKNWQAIYKTNGKWNSSVYAVEGQTEYKTTLTSIRAVPLDYKLPLTYQRICLQQFIDTFRAGKYNLTFTAMLRKSGTISYFNFTYEINDWGIGQTALARNTFTFPNTTTRDTQTITKSFEVTNPLKGQYITFCSEKADLGLNPTSYQVGAGITNVVLIFSCFSGYTLSPLVNGSKVCIPDSVIQACVNCKVYEYLVASDSYTCGACTAPLQLVDLSNNFKGCTPNLIPNALKYRPLTITDSLGFYYMTSASCSIAQNQGDFSLVVPNIASSIKDYSGIACTLPNPNVATWEVINQVYSPVSCSDSAALITLYSEKKDCVPLTSSFYDNKCTNYQLVSTQYQCIACSSGYDVISVNITGSFIKKCSLISEIISQCQTYLQIQNPTTKIYECQNCNVSFTLENTVDSKVCVNISLLDINCNFYEEVEGVFLCSQCKQNYTMQTVTSNGKNSEKCLSNTETIRNCLIYEQGTHGYQCHSCKILTDIAKFEITFDGVTSTRCLNAKLEYTEFCSNYAFSNGIYNCSSCATGYSLGQVLVNGQFIQKCLRLQVQYVNHCRQYLINDQSAYECGQCDDGYLMKNTPTSKICLSSFLIDPNCEQYTKNQNGVYECSRCLGVFQVSKVLVNGKIKIQCLSSELIPQCTLYLYNGATYECSTCSQGFNPQNINIDGTIQSQCWPIADTSYERCGIYTQLNSQMECVSCKYGFSLSSLDVSGTIKKVCLSLTEYIRHCEIYQLIQQKYTCKACFQTYFYRDVLFVDDVVKKCIKERDYDENCVLYTFRQECCFICHDCKEGYRLANVLEEGRVVPRCLKAEGQYLPYCDLYVWDTNNYYCKASYCEVGATQIYLDANPLHQACTKFELFAHGHNINGPCTYYQRPSQQDTDLKCFQCTDQFSTPPYCQQGLQEI